MIPAHANFQDSANRKTVRYLLKKSGGGIAVYLSPRMLHTKLIATEKMVSFGSTNITKKAFCQLSELNLFLHNNGAALPTAILQNEKERMAEATRVSDYRKIRYNAPLAFLEGFVV
jgi:phosphatidylserine/phosphatidylglycerophosphate/cardiolipin synthase-like enzyme